MNRRNFNKNSLLSILGLSASAPCLSQVLKEPEQNVDYLQQLKSQNGLILQLTDKKFATINKDSKQFILTYDVLAGSIETEEKIYHLINNKGKQIQLFMKPLASGQLQAVFNQRTHA